jgi:signal transduction histidine kinase/DNA-binding response OmpR family regulator
MVKVVKSYGIAIRGNEVQLIVPSSIAENGFQTVVLHASPWSSTSGTLLGIKWTFDDSPTSTQEQIHRVSWVANCLSTVLDQANAPFFSVRKDGTITAWNDYMEKLTKLASKDATKRCLPELLSTESQRRLQEAMEVAWESKLGPSVPLHFLDGFVIITGLSPQFDANGEVAGAICVGCLQRVSEESPSRLSTPVARINNKGCAAAMHEMRSPLHGIIGLASTLAQDEGTMQKPLKLISQGADRVLGHITSLMDYWDLVVDANIDVIGEEEGLQLDGVLHDVIQRCESAVDKRSRPIKRKEVTLTHVVDKDLRKLSWDANYIQQMLFHLVLNALKFTETGHVKVLVSNATNDGVQITIEDTGLGIAKHNMGRVFLPFEKEDNSESGAHEGLGLGLTIANEVVKKCGGTFDFDSTKGKGSTVTVVLPRRRMSVSVFGGKRALPKPFNDEPVPLSKSSKVSRRDCVMDCPWITAAAPPSAPKSFGGPSGVTLTLTRPRNEQVLMEVAEAVGSAAPTMSTFDAISSQVAPCVVGESIVMSVDDDHVNQEVMRSMLEPLGYKLIFCMDGQQCLKHMQSNQDEVPHLVLLDLMMPGMSGFDVLQVLRKHFDILKLPIIMVSAKNQIESVVRGFEIGCNDWVHKPFDRQDLTARVRLHLQIREATRRLISARSTQVSLDCLPEMAGESTKAVTPTVVQSSALWITLSTRLEGVSILAVARIFEAFTETCHSRGIKRVACVGFCYLAVQSGTSADTDSLMLLALELQGITRSLCAKGGDGEGDDVISFKAVIHSDRHTAPVIGRDTAARQYPDTSQFGPTVHTAMLISNAVSMEGIYMSAPTRSGLGIAVEHELRLSSMHIGQLNVGSSLNLDTKQGLNKEHDNGAIYRVMRAGDKELVNEQRCASNTATPSPQAKAPMQKAVMAEPWPPVLEGGIARQGASREVGKGAVPNMQHPEPTNQGALNMQHQHSNMQHPNNPVPNMQHPSNQNIPTQRPPQSMPTTFMQQTTGTMPPMDMVPGSDCFGPLMFLQWQNAHLQAELRHAQQQVFAAKAELSKTQMRSESFEKNAVELAERVEHLELDLCFRNICGSMSAPSNAGAQFAVATSAQRIDIDQGAAVGSYTQAGMVSSIGAMPRPGMLYGGSLPLGGQDRGAPPNA